MTTIDIVRILLLLVGLSSLVQGLLAALRRLPSRWSSRHLRLIAKDETEWILVQRVFAPFSILDGVVVLVLALVAALSDTIEVVGIAFVASIMLVLLSHLLTVLICFLLIRRERRRARIQKVMDSPRPGERL